ncbi:hypothetical protein LCGC14_0971260 [marine sediment metagenome]|uniref:Uncharacterized protein n=1 Tax=marine sediment metagenome TaxID=412755 RepID=A0A0F9QUU9_9ZZZZ
MGAYYELTAVGEKRLNRIERRMGSRGHAELSDDDFVLLEVGRNQSTSQEGFYHHMEELGYDRDVVRDLLADWHFAGYLK